MSCAPSSSGCGHRFFSGSDTEVILKGYREWGLGFVERLLGMFAFAIVEIESGRVMLGRDRLGIKPLYLSEDGERLRFASTPQALIAGGGVDTSVDRVALHHYMSWHAVVPPPRTILAGVRKLDPRRCSRSSRTAPAPADPIGGRASHATATPAGTSATGMTPCSRPCTRPSSAGWSPTSRSGCCFREASTRA